MDLRSYASQMIARSAFIGFAGIYMGNVESIRVVLHIRSIVGPANDRSWSRHSVTGQGDIGALIHKNLFSIVDELWSI